MKLPYGPLAGLLPPRQGLDRALADLLLRVARGRRLPAVLLLAAAPSPGRESRSPPFAAAIAGWVGGAPLALALGIEADVDTVIALATITWRDLEQRAQWGVLLLSTEQVPQETMIRCGIWLNMVSIPLITAVVLCSSR